MSSRHRSSAFALWLLPSSFFLLPFSFFPFSFAAPAAQQQAPRPTFRAGVDLVRVEVQVVDRDGIPVTPLGLTDFEVKIDGRKRPVVSADLINYDPALIAKSVVPAPSLAELGKRPSDRMFILAVDEASLKPGDAMVAAQAGRKFIDTLHETDYIGLYKFPLIERQLDLTHGHAAVKLALSKLTGSFMEVRAEFNLRPSEIVDITANDYDAWQVVARRECHADDVTCPDRIVTEARTSASYAEADAATRVHSLRYLLDALATVAGRKTLVVISGGMFSADRTAGRPNNDSMMARLGQEAAVANTWLYVLHLDSSLVDSLTRPGGRSPAPGDPHPFFSSARDGQIQALGLERLAGAAGGGYIRIQAGTPDYAFGRVLRESAAYYLLGVQPEDRDRDGRLHFIRTTVKAKGATVRGRTHVIIPRRK
jgi:VWFA-related protein